eukprot:607389-Prorocentrum_lima.AAC.1
MVIGSNVRWSSSGTKIVYRCDPGDINFRMCERSTINMRRVLAKQLRRHRILRVHDKWQAPPVLPISAD